MKELATDRRSIALVTRTPEWMIVVIRILSAFLVCLLVLIQARPAVRPVSQQPQAGSPAKSEITQPQGDARKDGLALSISTELVTLSVTVSGRDQRLVTGLDRRHFEIYEDKVKQSVEYFSHEDVPISVGIIFDVSGSMKWKLDLAREAVKSFIHASHPEDDFFLVSFSERPQLVAEFTDGDSLYKKLTFAHAHGATALYDALYLGMEKAKQSRHRKRALLLVTDGQDTASRYSFGKLRQLLKESDVPIYCLGVFKVDVDGCSRRCRWRARIALDEIAQITSGEVFTTSSMAEREEAAASIALELRRQYSLGYISTNQQRDGKWRKLQVRLHPASGLSQPVVRAKEGYYAPR